MQLQSANPLSSVTFPRYFFPGKGLPSHFGCVQLEQSLTHVLPRGGNQLQCFPPAHGQNWPPGRAASEAVGLAFGISMAGSKVASEGTESGHLDPRDPCFLLCRQPPHPHVEVRRTP